MMQLSVYKEHYKETIRLGVPIMLGQLGIIAVSYTHLTLPTILRG